MPLFNVIYKIVIMLWQNHSKKSNFVSATEKKIGNTLIFPGEVICNCTCPFCYIIVHLLRTFRRAQHKIIFAKHQASYLYNTCLSREFVIC